MPNIVEITIRTRSDTTGLAAAEAESKASGDRAGKGFGASFAKGLAGTAVAGAAASVAPLIAEVFSGAIVGGFGAALVGMAILGASKLKPVQQAFDTFKTRATQDLTDIGKPFAPVLEGILGTATTVMGKLTPVFTGAIKTISGPFEQFSETLTRSFDSPAVTSSINAIAKAFAAMLKSLSPSIPGMVNEIAGAIQQIADTFAQNPKAFTNIIQFFVDMTNDALRLIPPLTKFLSVLPPGVLGAIAAGFLAIAVGAKAAAAAEVLAAGPPGLVAAAIVLLALAFTECWQKSALFRDIIKDIATVMLQVGIIILKVNQDIVGSFLNVIGVIIGGLAKAFGGLPFGVGSALKSVAKSFDGFKSGVNDSFNSMIGQMQKWQAGLSGAASTAHDTTAKITADFASQQRAAGTARTALDNYTDEITKNGTSTAAAQRDRQQLITDMAKAGVSSVTAKTDVGDYTTAVSLNGSKSQSAEAARTKLISDILAVSTNSKRGQSDLSAFTAAVSANGTRSDAAKSARAKLIADLIGAGLDSRTATGLVNTLSTAISRIPSKKATVSVFASGGGGMTYTEKVAGSISSGGFSLHSLATGGLITEGTTPTADDVLARLSKGEAVVPAWLVPKVAPILSKHGVPGFANGGIAGMTPWASSAETSFASRVEHSLIALEAAHLKASTASAAKAAAAATASQVANVGSGVARWTADVQKALKMEGLPLSLTAQVLRQITTESGGNPNAINNSDSNAAAGDPSRGLLQTIMTTFEAYHWPGTSNNIYDPLANIAAAINYARHVYGPTLMRGGMGLGSGHGYSAGGATSAGWASVGERGRELVKLPGGAHVYPAGASAQMAAGGPAGPSLVQLEISGGSGEFEQLMSGFIKKYVRVKGGGDVQKAFGR